MPPPSSDSPTAELSSLLSHIKLPNGSEYAFLDQPPAWSSDHAPGDAPTLLLLHGFPDAWFSWQKLVLRFALAGFRVIVPSMFGYSGSAQSPTPPLTSFTPRAISTDLTLLLDLLEIKSVFVVGHDFGAVVAWRMLCWHPTRVLGLVSVCMPYTPPARSFLSHELMAQRAPQLGYMLFFDMPESTPEIESRMPRFVDTLFTSGKVASKHAGWTHPGQLRKHLLENTSVAPSDILSKREREMYIAHLREASMDGPLNYYRSHPQRHEEEQEMPPPPLHIPTLLIMPTLDPTNTPSSLERSKKWIPGLEVVPLEGVGHWALLERPKEVADIVGGFVGRCLQVTKAKF